MIDLPQKIVCVGLNYRDHAEEQGTELPSAPLLFAKWPNTLIGPVVLGAGMVLLDLRVHRAGVDGALRDGQDEVLTVAQATVECVSQGLVDNPLDDNDAFDQCVDGLLNP